MNNILTSEIKKAIHMDISYYDYNELKLSLMYNIDFSNIRYFNRMISLGYDILKLSLLVNSEMLQIFISLFTNSNNLIVERGNGNSAENDSGSCLEASDDYF